MLLLALLLPRGAAAQIATLPPGDRPVQVAAGFFVVNLSSVDERTETFSADLHLRLRWKDARLAFAGSEPVRLLEGDAIERLEDIWWPQLEFVNTSTPEMISRLFVVAYSCVALGVGIHTLLFTTLDESAATRASRWAGFGLPALFVVLMLAVSLV